MLKKRLGALLPQTKNCKYKKYLLMFIHNILWGSIQQDPKTYGQWQNWGIYWISCSNFLKSSVEKNSSRVISNPSQIFLIVDTVGFLLRLFTMLLTVDWVIPQIVHNLLIEIPRFWHNSTIRFDIACAKHTVTPHKTNFCKRCKYLKLLYANDLKKFNHI